MSSRSAEVPAGLEVKLKLSAAKWFLSGLLAGILITGVAYAARPGEVDDPLISLSYLRTAVSFNPVVLNDGEEINIAPGEEFILIDGQIKLECPGNFKAHDISRGKLLDNPDSVDKNHLIIFTANSMITGIGKGEAECLVRGLILD